MIGPISEETVRRARVIGTRGEGIIRERMDSTGDGTGTKEMATAADEYLILPGASDVYVIDNVQIIIRDNGGMPWEEFAAMGAALATGILFDTVRNGGSGLVQVVDLLDNKPITDNADLLALGTVSLSVAAVGTSVLTCKVDFESLLGFPLLFRGEHGDGLRFTTQDDMTSLESLEVWANGVWGH
jgi:hypothetical protein